MHAGPQLAKFCKDFEVHQYRIPSSCIHICVICIYTERVTFITYQQRVHLLTIMLMACTDESLCTENRVARQHAGAV